MSQTTAPYDATLFVQAAQQWSAGQQDGAIELIRPTADAGDARAAALMAWFLHQLGEPRWREAIPYATTAVAGGMPHAANYVVGNMLGQPEFMTQAVHLAQLAAPFGINIIDPIAQGVGFLQQGQTEAGNSLLSALPLLPGPLTTPAGWDALVAQAQSANQNVSGHLSQVIEKRNSVEEAASTAVNEFANRRAEIENQSTQLLNLITTTTNAQASSFFETEASSAKTEATITWRVGIGVVIAAAIFALLPMAGHYWGVSFGSGRSALAGGELLSAHVAAALGFAALSGVLLTRSRVRDRNRQRNKDLSVALNTMFAYGTQIQDEQERQKFIHDMGRTVIEAYLRQDASSDDETRSLLALLSRPQ